MFKLPSKRGIYITPRKNNQRYIEYNICTPRFRVQDPLQHLSATPFRPAKTAGGELQRFNELLEDPEQEAQLCDAAGISSHLAGEQMTGFEKSPRANEMSFFSYQGEGWLRCFTWIPVFLSTGSILWVRVFSWLVCSLVRPFGEGCVEAGVLEAIVLEGIRPDTRQPNASPGHDLKDLLKLFLAGT